MPIQNIDNYLMPTRSQEASILKFHGDSRLPLEQQFLTNEVNDRAERNLNRTGETKKADKKDKGFDAKKKGSNEYYILKKKKQKKEDKQTEPPKESFQFEGRTIDIKL